MEIETNMSSQVNRIQWISISKHLTSFAFPIKNRSYVLYFILFINLASANGDSVFSNMKNKILIGMEIDFVE